MVNLRKTNTDNERKSWNIPLIFVFRIRHSLGGTFLEYLLLQLLVVRHTHEAKTSIHMGNQMATSNREIRKYFHARFVKILIISQASRRENLFRIWAKRKCKYFLILWEYHVITFQYHEWQITLTILGFLHVYCIDKFRAKRY